LKRAAPAPTALLYDGSTIGIPLEAVGGDALLSGIKRWLGLFEQSAGVS